MFGFGNKKQEKKDILKGNTFFITEGKIPIDSRKVEALHFAIDEGMSDQTIMTVAKALMQDLSQAERQLEKVI